VVDHEGCHVVDVERAEAVLAVAEEAEDGEVSEDPGDVVDEDVAAAEEDAGSDDGVGDAGLFEGEFEFVLSVVVAEIVGGAGVEDADVDDAFDAGGAGGVEEGFGVGDGVVEGEELVIEADPVGVVENVGAFEGLGEFVGVVEGEGADFELVAEGVWAVGGVGECADADASVEELLGD